VLYRTTAQSRALEECFRRLGIRYRVVGGFSFYQRAEVRDALAYLRLVFHPEDDIALLRVLNTPPRGIGDKTVELLEKQAREKSTSLWNAIPEVARPGVARGGAALSGFRVMIESLRDAVKGLAPPAMLRRILDASGYLGWIEQQDNMEHTTRGENLSELLNALAEATEAGLTLEDILDQAALVSATDDIDETASVTLMTLHSAKGLEFDIVYLAGLDEGLLPHTRSKEQDEDIEEERRLFYVGMTRAKESLTLTRAQHRRTWGEERQRTSAPSRFLREIPGELIETVAGSLGEPGETRRYVPDPETLIYRARQQRAPAARPRFNRGGTAAPRRNSHPLVGTRVRHKTFGLGTIIAVEEEEEDRLLTVSFADHGTKKLMERYANLQLV
jgi:DNA helicase II / ATP-dependent DNA helicase PcrA